MQFHYTAFNNKGLIASSGYREMPEYLDWMSIEVKEVWFRYMGGLSQDVQFVLLKSQGETKLIWDIDDHSKMIVDLKLHQERKENVKEHINNEIQRLRLKADRQGGNQ